MATYRIGRAEGNHIVLGDKSVSRTHAELEELGAGRFRLKDLGSSAGTFVLVESEWKRIEESEVRHDTRIRFGEHETTPMDLVRDQDKTVVQAKPGEAAAPRPAAPPPPRPAPPVAPRPRPAAGASAATPKMLWWILGGGVAFLALVGIAVAVVLLTGGSDERRTANTGAPPGRTDEARRDTPPANKPADPPANPPAKPPANPPADAPRRDPPPATGAGEQKFMQACTQIWKGQQGQSIPQATCQCYFRLAQPILQEGDYDDFIEVLTLSVSNKQDEARQRLQGLPQDRQERIRKAVQAWQGKCGG